MAVERTRSGLTHWVNVEKPCNVKIHALSFKVTRGQLPFPGLYLSSFYSSSGCVHNCHYGTENGMLDLFTGHGSVLILPFAMKSDVPITA